MSLAVVVAPLVVAPVAVALVAVALVVVAPVAVALVAVAPVAVALVVGLVVAFTHRLLKFMNHLRHRLIAFAIEAYAAVHIFIPLPGAWSMRMRTLRALNWGSLWALFFTGTSCLSAVFRRSTTCRCIFLERGRCQPHARSGEEHAV